MSSTTEQSNERTLKRLFSSLLNRFHKPASMHIDAETLRRVNAPAKLFTWQTNGETEESQTFDTLHEAVAHVPENPEDRTFIITESGQIIRPAQIVRLKYFLDKMR